MENMKKTKSPADTRSFIDMVADKQKWKVNPDNGFVDMLVVGLTKNYNRYGYFACPCREADGTREKDVDIICPCAYCRPDQKEYGHCYCWLFLVPDFFDTGKQPQYIPDRRQLNP